MIRDEEINQKARELALDWNVGRGNEFYYRFDKLIDIARWADEHRPNPWTSVEERLPEITKEVKGEYKTRRSDEVFVRLVSNSGEVRHSSGYLTKRESLPRGCTWNVNMFSCEHVTHWMPIPGLKGEKQ